MVRFKTTGSPEEKTNNVDFSLKRFTCAGDGEPIAPGEVASVNFLLFPGFLFYKVIMAGYIGSTIQYQMAVDPTPMYGLMSQVVHLPNCTQLQG